jgi:hypothetical protein
MEKKWHVQGQNNCVHDDQYEAEDTGIEVVQENQIFQRIPKFLFLAK